MVLLPASLAAVFWKFSSLCNLGLPLLTTHTLIVHPLWTTSLTSPHFFSSSSGDLFGSQGHSSLLFAPGQRTFLPLLPLLFSLADFHQLLKAFGGSCVHIKPILGGLEGNRLVLMVEIPYKAYQGL